MPVAAARTKKGNQKSNFSIISVYVIYFFSFGINLEGEAEKK